MAATTKKKVPEKQKELYGIPLSCQTAGEERLVATGKSITVLKPAYSKRKATTTKKGGK